MPCDPAAPPCPPQHSRSSTWAHPRGVSLRPTRERIMPAVSEAAELNGPPGQATLDPSQGNGVGELHELLHALQAMRVGDFSVRMASDQTGVIGKIADTFNEIVAANQRMAQQLERV